MAIDKEVGYWREEIERSMAGARTVKAGGVLYMTGVTSVDDNGKVVGAGDMEAQLKQIYATLAKILAKNNLTFEHVVKENIYVTDGKAFFAAHHIRTDIYKGLLPPAITGVEVAGLFNPELLVEIDLTVICN